jgi:hypothetical protein
MTSEILFHIFDEIEHLNNCSQSMKLALKSKVESDSEEDKLKWENQYKVNAGEMANHLSNLIVLIGIDDMVKESLTK